MGFAVYYVPGFPLEAEMTSWFIGQVAGWNRVMNSRHEFDSLKHTEHGRERITFLRDYLQWFGRWSSIPSVAGSPFKVAPSS